MNTTASMKDKHTAGLILLPKYNSAIDIGTYAKLYVAPEEAEIVTITCSLGLNGPGFKLKLFFVNGNRISQAGSDFAIQSPT